MPASKPDFDALMVDWLYGELPPDEVKSFEKHLESHPEAAAEAAALKETRAAFQGLESAEPPSALTAMLMHEAGVQADSKSLWERFAAFFQPIVMHPAASAMATLVLVAGVAGSLYLRNGDMSSQPKAKSESAAPANVASLEAARDPAPPSPAAATAPVPPSEDNFKAGLAEEASAADGESYSLDVAGEQDQRDLDTALERNRALAKETSKGRGDFAFDGKKATGRRSGVVDRQLARGSADAPSPEPVVQSQSEIANVVSGAGGFSQPGSTAGLVDFDDDGVAAGPTAKPVSKRPARKSAPAPTKSDRSKTGKQKGKSVEKKNKAPSWEARQNSNLQLAARGKRCKDAGRIANDILDKKPSFYRKSVEKTKGVSDCRFYVANETKRRAKSRAKRAAKRNIKGQGTSVPSKAKAAPLKDEAAMESAL